MQLMNVIPSRTLSKFSHESRPYPYVLIALRSSFSEALILLEIDAFSFLCIIFVRNLSYYWSIHRVTIFWYFSYLNPSYFNILEMRFVLLSSISYASLISISLRRVLRTESRFSDSLGLKSPSILEGRVFYFPTCLCDYLGEFWSWRHWITFFCPSRELILFLKYNSREACSFIDFSAPYYMKNDLHYKEARASWDSQC